jgi:hypothetical protein
MCSHVPTPQPIQFYIDQYAPLAYVTVILVSVIETDAYLSKAEKIMSALEMEASLFPLPQPSRSLKRFHMTHINFALSVPGVICGLHVQPRTNAATKHLADQGGHIWGEWFAFSQNIIKMLAGNAQALRNFNLWHFKVIKNIDENSTRMRRATVRIANGFICWHWYFPQ